MEKLKWFVLWLTLWLIIFLIVFSVYGAFLGADRAKVFFNSIPLAVYWFALLLTLVIGFLVFKALLRVPAALLVHLGCVAILIGGLWGSRGGQQLQAALFGRNIIPEGQMAILTGDTESRVRTQDGNDRPLPFSLALDNFRIEYYKAGTLYIGAKNDQGQWAIKAEPGTSVDLGPQLGTVKIINTFQNFKMDLEGERKVYDDPDSGSNPAVEVLVTPPGDEPRTEYVFERQAHTNRKSPLVMQYKPVIRDYISHVRVLKDGNTVAGKAIEVNHPLYYGGYHFYQSSYGRDTRTGQMYTVLSVVSNSGLNWVFAGYLMLCIGAVWKCWFIRLRYHSQESK